MKEFKFNFLNGYYLVCSDKEDVVKNLQRLQGVQTFLRSICPLREREIDGFVLSVCNEITGVK